MCSSALDPVKAQLTRQVVHWRIAVAELSEISLLASATAWRSLERYLGVVIETTLRDTVNRLAREARVLEAQLLSADSPATLERLRIDLVAFRSRYLAAEAVLEFYGNAINSRTQERLGDYLRACDRLAVRAMASVLTPLGRRVSPVLTYLDPGLGASILKAGLRLWDGHAISPVAAIKLARHNLLRPTSTFHEAAHQLAADVGWTAEASRTLRDGLARHGSELAELWQSWSSELVADSFCFAQTGYASVAALSDVVSGDSNWVVGHVPGDPHPISYLRVLLGRAMCVRFFGQGPWDELARAWVRTYSAAGAAHDLAEILRRSVDLLPEIVELLFFSPLRCFGGKSLQSLVDPMRVKPEALAELELSAGAALFTSDHWISRECVRLVAICGLRAALPGDVEGALHLQEQWMLRLGRSIAAA